MIYRSVFYVLFLVSISFSESSGSRSWEPLDVPGRAMWVWNMAKTSEGLPESRDTTPTKQQKKENKTVNKTWGGVPSWKRVQENYKGVQDLFFDFCGNKSIRDIYVFGSVWQGNQKLLNGGRLPKEERWIDFNKKAHERGMRVWLCYYLWDNSNDERLLQDFDGIRAHAKAVSNFNKAHPESAFAGIHCDQEPGQKNLYVGLLRNMDNGQKWIDNNNAGILNSAALRPAWRNAMVEWQGESKTMNEAVIDTISHSALMCYYDNIKVINKWSDPVVAYATQKGKSAAIGFEVNCLTGFWEGSEHETWWGNIRAESDKNRFKVNLNDNTISFEDAMHLTSKRHSNKKGFDCMVIHSYSGYFEHWFGMFPRDYLESLPGKGYDSAAVKPAFTNLKKDHQRPVIDK